MGTMLTKRITYDASAEEVAAMLDDPTFREAVLERQKVLRGSVDIDGDVVTIEQVLPATGLPSFAKKFVGDEIDIVQKETWTSPTTCDIELSIPGKPGGAVGTIELTETDGRTTETIRLDLLAPEMVEVSYWPSSSTGLLFGFEVTGGQYRVRTSEATGSESADVQVQEVISYLGLNYRMSDYFSLLGRAGLVLAGDYDLTTGAAGADRIEGALDQSFFAEISFGIDF